MFTCIIESVLVIICFPDSKKREGNKKTSELYSVSISRYTQRETRKGTPPIPFLIFSLL